MPHVDRSQDLYLGSHGVYGSRLANWAVQSADRILVLGSRLDNRQRTGNPEAYAPFAHVMVLDIDSGELDKFRSQSNYVVRQVDLSNFPDELDLLGKGTRSRKEWNDNLFQAREAIDDGMSVSVAPHELSPYSAVREIQKKFAPGSVVVSDCGANLCWVYQAYQPDDSYLFTAAGNSPMGYALPAAIGAQLASPDSQVWCFIGDGGLQMNIQELQTVSYYNLPIKIVVLNNDGFGIIKQFQDSYFDGRHEASGTGYSTPNFGDLARAYGLAFCEVDDVKQLSQMHVDDGPIVIDVHLPSGALITPKVEMDQFLHNQFPYSDEANKLPTAFDYPKRPSHLHSE